jgi:hypothetical protein
MRRRHRGILAVLSVVGLAVIVSLVGWRLWAGYLPDPQQADVGGLMRWLVLAELTDEPWDRQIVFVDRLEQELSKGGHLTGNAESLSQQSLDRLQRNAQLLKRVWFQSRVDRYASCPEAERFDFLTSQIKTVMVWSQFDIPTNGAVRQVDPIDGQDTATMRFFSDIERWISEADEDHAVRMRQAVRDGLTCWLATSDLAEEPMPTRRELARRIESELENGLQLNQVVGDLDQQRQQTLQANGLLLLEAWLHNGAEQYAALPTDQRTAYVDTQLERVNRWHLIDFLNSQGSDGSPAGSQNGAAALMVVVDGWIERAEPDLQPQLGNLVRHIQQRVLWQSLRGLWQ